MKFTGRIRKMLPQRSGTSRTTGNEWVAQPFIFEYYEHETDRYSDSVLLQTFDTELIAKMKEGAEVTCDFGHRTREYEGNVYNELRLFRMEFVGEHPSTGSGTAEVGPSTGTSTELSNHSGTAADKPAASDEANKPADPADDLPF